MTFGLTVVHCPWPPCMQVTVPPMLTIGPASYCLQGAAVDVNHRAGDLDLPARLDFELRSAIESGAGAALEIEFVPSVELDPLRCLQLEIPLGFERHVLLALDVNLALGRDTDLGVGLVERDLQLAIAADEGNPRVARVVAEDELVALARDEATPL